MKDCRGTDRITHLKGTVKGKTPPIDEKRNVSRRVSSLSSSSPDLPPVIVPGGELDFWRVYRCATYEEQKKPATASCRLFTLNKSGVVWPVFQTCPLTRRYIRGDISTPSADRISALQKLLMSSPLLSSGRGVIYPSDLSESY